MNHFIQANYTISLLKNWLFFGVNTVKLIAVFVRYFFKKNDCYTPNSHFEIIANEHGITISDVWQICYFTQFEIQADNYHFHAQNLADKLSELEYDQIEGQVIKSMVKIPRCSSMVTSFNSRLGHFWIPEKSQKKARKD